MSRRSIDWLPISLLSAGTVLLLLALYFSWGERRFAVAADQVPAVVIEAPAGGEDDPDRSYGRVALRYGGQRHELRMEPGSGSGTLPQDVIVGDVQTFLVPSGQPERARTADFANRYALKLVLLFFAAILLLSGCVAWLSGGHLARDSTPKVALAFLALGLVIIGAAGATAWTYKAWRDRSVEAIGVAESRGFRVRIRVTDRLGRVWHARAPFLPDRLPEGRDYVTVPIRYHQDRPWEVAAFGAWQYWSTPLFLAGFGLAWCSVPLLGLWLMYRWRRRREAERSA